MLAAVPAPGADLSLQQLSNPMQQAAGIATIAAGVCAESAVCSLLQMPAASTPWAPARADCFVQSKILQTISFKQARTSTRRDVRHSVNVGVNGKIGLRVLKQSLRQAAVMTYM